MNEKIPIDLIRDYLKGKLSQSERDSFKKRIESDPELARELASRCVEMAASELLIASDMRDVFREWRENNPRHGGLSGLKSLLWLGGIAAGILLAFAAVQVFGPPAPDKSLAAEKTELPPETPTSATFPPGEQQLSAGTVPQKTVPAAPRTSGNYRALAAEFLPEPVLATQRRALSGSALATIFDRAEHAYSVGDYQGALRLLAQTDSSRLQAATFLSAHALFKIRRYTEAETEFSRLVAWNSRQFRYSAEWGQFMCRLAGLPAREKVFREQLNVLLSSPNHPYFEQAGALEKKMRE